ncbi:related to guanine nucleotide-binding protein alpha-4 subunit [Serendipita indica DSM 11827]|uniref:Related to guanine nucleotide-binding protein alpha-4 subunit n=1 Tax=Serendipita indica (strain DSM 11827) TaxID=1109443 RepID=G4TFN6_SERID|nr:related to guanine nucleotide-binding protein alpha-4 subunit [Serendipita indica DSM 11827]
MSSFCVLGSGLFLVTAFHAERAAWRMVIIFNLVRSIRMLHDIISEAISIQEALKTSPTSPFLTRSPMRDFSDLLPPLPPPAASSLNHKHSSGSLIAPHDVEGDATDGASTHSGKTSSSVNANPVKRTSFFSKEPKDGVSAFSSRSADKVRQQTRPATSSGVPSSAFCLPSSSFGSNRAKPAVTPPHGTPLRRGASDDWKLSAPPNQGLHRSRSGESSNQVTSALAGTIAAGTSASPPQKTGPASISGASDSGTSSGSRPGFSRPRYEGEAKEEELTPLTFTNVHQLLIMRIKPLLSVEQDLLKRLSTPDEYEAVRLDFNLSAMHEVAVSAARKSTSSHHSVGDKSLKVPRSHSSSGRPRARSSVDISSSAIESFGTTSTASSTVTVTPKKEKKKSNTVPSLSSPSLEKLGSSKKEKTTSLAKSSHSGMLIPPARQQPSAPIEATTPTGDQSYIVGIGHGFGQTRRASEGDESSGGRPKPGGGQTSTPEFYVRSTANWKERIWKWAKYDPTERLLKSSANGDRTLWDDERDPARMIQTFARDINALWRDPVVQEYLKSTITHWNSLLAYDILRARLKTIGVTEHALHIDTRGSVPKDWLVYDVGGSRTQRAAWMPYFDASDAIIFIANVAAFDQTLEEDPTMNRMEDSLRLFRELVRSPILKDVNIILFLNKVDLLDAKLKSGIQLARYFRRYGERANDTEAVLKYFRAKFGAIYAKYTPSQTSRVYTVHETSLIDRESTKDILQTVSKTIIQAHVQKHMG